MKHPISILFSLFLILILQTSCGSIETHLESNDSENQAILSVTEGLNDSESYAFVFSTSFDSNGQIYLATLNNNETNLFNTNVTNLGSSAQILANNQTLYVLHDGFSLESSDNLQSLSINNDLATTSQWSIGNGTNPQNLVIANGNAFISLYNPTADLTNVDENGNPGDVIEINPATGEVQKRYSFYSSLNDDGDVNAHASPILFNQKIYVGLQDLDSTTFQPNSAGKLGVINPQTQNIEIVVSLEGRNPVHLAKTSNKIWIAHQASYNFNTFTFDTSTIYGGIEVVDANSYETLYFFDDEDLGGYVEKIITNGSKLFAVVSSDNNGEFTSRILAFDADISHPDDAEIFYDSGVDIRALSINNDYLWVSTQESGNANPKILVFDIETGNQIGSALEPTATGMSLTN